MAGPLEDTKLEAFLRHYASGMAGGRAWEKAGYNSRGNAAEACASRALTYAKVQERLSELKAELTAAVVQEFKYTVLDVANELAKIGFHNFAEYAEVRGKSIILDMSKATPDHLAAVKSIKTKYVAVTDKDENGRTIDTDEVAVETEVQFHDKKAALIALGDHLGMFPKTLRVGGDPNNDTPIKTDDVSDATTRREEAKMVAFYLALEANEARLADIAAETDEQQPDVAGAEPDDEQEDDEHDDEQRD